jgi:hypothetical protein
MSQSQPTRSQHEGVDLEPLLAEESQAGDGIGDGDNAILLPATGRSSGDAIEHHDEECSPVGRSFLGPMLGRSNLSALTSCALLAGCTVLHRISYLHHFRV